MLLTKDIRDWVDEGSPEQFVSDTIDLLDEEGWLDPFSPEPQADGRGRHRYHPVMLLKVLVFTYCNGIRSSRTIDRLLERDVAFRFLAANQQPNFRTICNFRTDNREAFTALFAEVLELCDEAGMVDIGEVALDGRRQGDSAVDQNRIREQIENKIDEILEEAAEIDDQEDEEYGPENRGDELPKSCKTRRIALSDSMKPKRTSTSKNRRAKTNRSRRFTNGPVKSEKLGRPSQAVSPLHPKRSSSTRTQKRT